MKQVSTLSIVLQTYDTALGRWEGVIFRHYLNNLHKPQNSLGFYNLPVIK